MQISPPLKSHGIWARIARASELFISQVRALGDLMGVSPMEQQEYSFTIAFSSYLLRGLGDGRPQPAEHQCNQVVQSVLLL